MDSTRQIIAKQSGRHFNRNGASARTKCEQSAVTELYWQSLLVRFCVGIGAWAMLRFSNLVLVADAKQYDDVAGGIADDWLSGRESSWLALHGHETFQPVTMVTLLACFYVLTLGVRALPLLIFLYCAITAFVPSCMYWIVRELGGSTRTALFSARIVVFCPVFVIWSSALYKEGLILLVLSMALFHALRFQSTRDVRSLTALVLCIAALLGLRAYLVPVLGLALCVGIQMRRTLHRTSFSPRLLAKQTLIVSSFVVLGMLVTLGTKVSLDDSASDFGDWEKRKGSAWPSSIEEAVAQISLSRKDLAAAPSGYLKNVEFASFMELLQFMPQGTAYFMAVPLPWHIGTFRQNLAIPDTALWVFCFYPLCAVGAWHMLKRDAPATLMFLIAALAMCALYGVFIGNVGAAYRMRSQVWLLFVPFVGIGWEIVNGRVPLVVIPNIRRRPASNLARPDRVPVKAESTASKTISKDRAGPESIT